MIAEEAARERILAAVHFLGAETVALRKAHRRFAAAELTAGFPLPMFDNSAMDGYAVRAAEAVRGAVLTVAGEHAAGGAVDQSVKQGQTVRIFTGGAMPAGADTVIMQEDTEAIGEKIRVRESASAGDHVRRAGGDVAAGQIIARKGEGISPQLASLLAAQGIAHLEVGRAPSVAILSTGDELLPPEATLRAGKIYESNGVLLEMLAVAAGARVAAVEHARDEAGELSARLAALLQNDVLIISGGVSVGDRDLVKAELQKLGVELNLWRVAIRPGKPFVFGTWGGCRIFGLPGNPVSSFVTFLCFVRPALLKMAGASDLSLRTEMAVAGAELSNPGDRPHYLRGRLAAGIFTPFGRQESHALFGLSQSNALVRLAPSEKIARGAAVTALSWD